MKNQPALFRAILHHVVRALVLSCIDYGNVLLFGATSYEVDGVQCLQNSASHLVCSAPLREHITPSIRELHLLPRERIHFKFALFVYKLLNKTTPGYLSNLLSYYTPPHFLLSTLDINP